MTTEEMQKKPVEQGYIYLTESEFKGYVDYFLEQRRRLYPDDDIAQQEKDMLSGRKPVTFHEAQVKVRVPNESQDNT